MFWQRTSRNDARVRALADRHYNRQSIGALDYTPPGCCIVLYAESGAGQAMWITSWQKRFAKHAWPGAWICSAFRNEGLGPQSSALIREAVAATRAIMGPVPDLGMVTFVNIQAVRPKRDPGRCFRKAGFAPVGWTKQRRRLALQLLPAAMPEPELPAGVLI